MIRSVQTVLSRKDTGLWKDAIGMVALSIILFGVLHLPGPF